MKILLFLLITALVTFKGFSQNNSRLITKIGDYVLDKNIETISNIEEFSNKEYKKFEQNGFTKAFDSDKFYWTTSQISFAQNIWDLGIIATHNNSIYKIYISSSNQLIFDDVYSYLRDNMGDCNEQSNGMYIWDKREGNLILQKDYAGIALFITSSSISK